MIGRRWPRCSAVNLDWDDSAGNLLGSGVTWHFPERTALRNRLAIVDRRPHALAGQHCDVSHGILVGVSIGGKVSKIWNARDKAAIALAIDRRPVPTLYMRPPFAPPKGSYSITDEATALGGAGRLGWGSREIARRAGVDETGEAHACREN